MAAAEDNNLYDITAGEFIKKIAELNGVDASDLVKKHGTMSKDGKKKREFVIRTLFEQSSPTTQCNEFIGKCPSDSPPCKCWLCGENITNPNGKHPLGPACEHKIPVMAANLIIGGLYTPQLKKDAEEMDIDDTDDIEEQSDNGPADAEATNNDEDNMLRGKKLNSLFSQQTLSKLVNEYAYAHSFCNGIKSSELYINTNGTFNDTKIITTLEKIWRDKNFNSLRGNIQKNKNEWIQERLDSIHNDLRGIQDEIMQQNSRGNNLSLLANTASVIHNLIHDDKHSEFKDDLMDSMIENPPRYAVELMFKPLEIDQLSDVSKRIPKLIVETFIERTVNSKLFRINTNHKDDIRKFFNNKYLNIDYYNRINDFLGKYKNILNSITNEKDKQEFLTLMHNSYIDIFYLKFYLASLEKLSEWTMKETLQHTRTSNNHKLSFLTIFNTIPIIAKINPNYEKYKKMFLTDEEILILDSIIQQEGGKKRKQNKYVNKYKKSKKNKKRKPKISIKKNNKVNRNKSKNKIKKNKRKSIKK